MIRGRIIIISLKPGCKNWRRLKGMNPAPGSENMIRKMIYAPEFEVID
jgi:hypothetical protein